VSRRLVCSAGQASTMGRKKAGAVAAPQEGRLFCYFCDRNFDDEGTLIQHQRAKHFRCPDCDITAVRGKCESVQGLIVHTLKVHTRTLRRVPNALPDRDNPDLNVYGMDGIPADLLRERGVKQHVLVGKAPPPPAPEPSFMDMPTFPPMPGLPGLPGVPSLPGLPPPAAQTGGAGPSLEGFQAFLAAQKQGSPLSPAAPCSPGAAAPLLPAAPHLPPPVPMPEMPPLPAIDGAPQKRRLEEDDGQDVSAEEKRAQLSRYRLVS